MRKPESLETVRRRVVTRLAGSAEVIRGISARTETPLQGIAAIKVVDAGLVDAERDLVRLARADGATWAQIGSTLGISRQAAWERFSGV